MLPRAKIWFYRKSGAQTGASAPDALLFLSFYQRQAGVPETGGIFVYSYISFKSPPGNVTVYR